MTFTPYLLVLDDVGLIQLIGLLHGIGAVAREAVQPDRFCQHLLARRHPLITGIADHLDDLLRDGAFAGPQAARRAPVVLLINLDALLQLRDGVVGIRKAIGHDGRRIA